MNNLFNLIVSIFFMVLFFQLSALFWPFVVVVFFCSVLVGYFVISVVREWIR